MRRLRYLGLVIQAAWHWIGSLSDHMGRLVLLLAIAGLPPLASLILEVVPTSTTTHGGVKQQHYVHPPHWVYWIGIAVVSFVALEEGLYRSWLGNPARAAAAGIDQAHQTVRSLAQTPGLHVTASIQQTSDGPNFNIETRPNQLLQDQPDPEENQRAE